MSPARLYLRCSHAANNMAQHIPESELIITAQGAIYHLDLRPEQLAPTVITVGSPDRVKEVSKYFDKVTDTAQHREFITHTGYIGNKHLSVISTGIGVGNIDIVMNEIDALANIDFTTRTIKKEVTTLNIIRLGTCGALQPEIAVDSLIATTYSIGMDNLLLYYDLENTPDEMVLLQEFELHMGTAVKGIKPYIVGSADDLRTKFDRNFVHGITVTCPGFYGPQGRMLRLSPALHSLPEKLAAFRHHGNTIANFEMETAALYGMARLLGHNCVSISTAIANRALKEFSKDHVASVENMIRQSLEVISDL